MSRIRLVVTTKRGEVAYSAFNDVTPSDLLQIENLCEMMGKLEYFKLAKEDGSKVYFAGDALESIAIEESKL